MCRKWDAYEAAVDDLCESQLQTVTFREQLHEIVSCWDTYDVSVTGHWTKNRQRQYDAAAVLCVWLLTPALVYVLALLCFRAARWVYRGFFPAPGSNT